MTLLENIRSAVAEFAECVEDGGRIAVPTQYLYPSNGCVTAYVAGDMAGQFRVSDDGGALDSLSAHGLSVSEPSKLVSPFCKRRHLKEKNGIIYAPRVPIEGLSTAIVMVAAASSEAAAHGIKAIKPARRKELAAAVYEALERFCVDRRISPTEHIIAEERIAGLSNRQYVFDYVVHVDTTEALLVDAVVPEATSINSTVVSHIDVGQTKNPKYRQIIVYDPNEQWNSSDLNLLQMAAVTVPLPYLTENLSRLSV
jgi:hypothetical protein